MKLEKKTKLTSPPEHESLNVLEVGDDLVGEVHAGLVTVHGCQHGALEGFETQLTL